MSEAQYPLGRPKRVDVPPEEERWVVLDPSKPYIETNSKTGYVRNTRPPPPPRPWFVMN